MEQYRQTKRFENFVRLSVLFLVALVFVAAISFVKLGNARRESEKYDTLIAELTLEKEKVNISIEEKKSSDYLEKQVREKGMIKGNETYIEFK